MPTYTMSDVREADQLWDEMPLRDVADYVEPSVRTLSRWASKGLISTESNHREKHDKDKVQRADELWDVMPLSKISEVIGVPYSCLREWSRAGRISTDKTWNGCGFDAEVPTKMIVEAYHKDESVTYDEVAQQFGISSSTVGYHLRKYRNGDL